MSRSCIIKYRYYCKLRWYLWVAGNNGAEKTTLLRILTGQDESSSGEFELFEKTSKVDLGKARRRTGTIIESPSFTKN